MAAEHAAYAIICTEVLRFWILSVLLQYITVKSTESSRMQTRQDRIRSAQNPKSYLFSLLGVRRRVRDARK